MKYEKNDKVLHRVFGAGTVQSVDNINNLVIVKFDCLATERAIKADFKGMKKGGKND